MERLDERLDDYLERLASSEAVPGGGSAAAVVGAMAASLAGMVGRKLASVRSMEKIVTRADELRAELLAARRRDEEAYGAYVAARKLPKGNDAEIDVRIRALEAALNGAAEAPLRTAGAAVEVLELAEELADGKMGALASDVGCAAEFAHAAVAGCGYNVRINHRYMHDEAAILQQAARLVAYEGRASVMLGRVRDAVARAPKR